MFPLCRQFSVFGHSSPSIGQYTRVALALIDHRLYGECDAFFERRTGTGAAIVQDLRILMENFTDAVAAKFLNHRETVSLCMGLDGKANITKSSARLNELDTSVHAFLGGLD